VARAESSSPAAMILAIFRMMAFLLANRPLLSMAGILGPRPAAVDRISC
jgi:hypothetical protein